MNEPKNLNKKKPFILLGVLLVIVIIVIVAVLMNNKGGNLAVNTGSKIPEITNNNPATTTPEEVAPSKSVITLATATPEIIKESAAVAVGSSLVTKDNKVITPEGTPVKLNVVASSPEAPTESQPVKGVIATNDNNVKISISAAGFVPKEFTVKEGQLVNFVLTSTDAFTHVVLFDDPSLTSTLLGVAGYETRIKSWNAPKKGTYTFHCDIPGHALRGETGTMIVN